jgi:hypothetical protein
MDGLYFQVFNSPIIGDDGLECNVITWDVHNGQVYNVYQTTIGTCDRLCTAVETSSYMMEHGRRVGHFE